MSDTILGIHSNVRPGMIDPSTGQPRDPGISDGHGWLTVTRDGQTTAYGLWPDDHPRVVEQGWNNGEGSDVRVGMENKYRPAASRYYRLTPEQVKTLDARLKENATWGVTENCSSWASSTLEAVTGERINADEPYTAGVVETPRMLGESIHRLEQKDRTSREAPATPTAAEARSSSSLSDARGAQQPAALSPRAQNLLNDSEYHVRQLAERHHLPWNPGMDNTVAAVAQQARADGLTGINRFNVRDGQIHYGQYDGHTLKDGRIDARVAANIPETVSRQGLAQTDLAMGQQEARVAERPPQMAQGALQRA